jgi:hypothetical protein
LAIVLSVLLSFTDSGGPFGIFKLFFKHFRSSIQPMSTKLTHIDHDICPARYNNVAS